MQELVYFYPLGHEAHREPGHPERPERVEAMRQALEGEGWWQSYPCIEPFESIQEVLTTIHDRRYLTELERACQRGLHLDADTYTTPDSWELAKKAAGGAAAVASQVWEGKARRGFAFTRPPGHHATHNRGMGFCLINNAAYAAEALLQSAGAQRLAIVDLDLHHGNGTQDIFWQRGDVFYLSTHQSPLYPGTGQMDERGAGQGLDATVNLPLPPLAGDTAFRASMEEVILPLLDRYGPQMLLVSVGFDPHWRDPLGNLLLSAAGFNGMIRSMCEWADKNCEGKISLILEGGYDLSAAAACALAGVAALTGKDFNDPLGPSPHAENNAWRMIINHARRIWEL